ncbi:PTS sugar transporter subunit IIC [Erysipelothrix urinaevulpis]|uniref:PTS mannose/fructose/sorbose/N-acetylgalactosamine transporter subunit IIC n=1 Tax=Erysipelothrix urinaevulpis TaxID=2683717 RepID=UPI00135AD09F|nr:PTS sugar transporter subunit IIC [Erysipelothrix urinaevulpis]
MGADFTIVQYVLVFIVAFIAAIDQFSFLESLYQPIVLGPIVGWILGDIGIGLAVGGTYQLIQIGSMPIGGAQPPNAVIGGIMATVFAISIQGIDASAAVGLAVPFALLGQYAVTTAFTLMSPLMARADLAAENADPKGIERINYLGMLIIGTLFAIIVMIGMKVGTGMSSSIMQWAADNSWFMAGLAAAGNMMRYVGFAILMKIMLSGELWGFFLLGFAFASIVGGIGSLKDSALLIIALIGLAIAIYDFQMNTKIKSIESTGGDEDGI